MEYIGFVFGLFGLMAYLELSGLKKRISQLEDELSSMKGTSYHEERTGLLKAVRDYIGQSVILEMKEDYEDSDIIMYGNSKHGTNTILECDSSWVLVRIEAPKFTKEKLIRTESIDRISLRKGE
jgi:hypothetical protein